MKRIDEKICNMIEKFEPHECFIPAIINNEVLKKCGSFQSFPQHITYCAINKDKDDPAENEGESDKINNSGYSLTPAACLHFYPMLSGQTIEKKCLTTKAKVYRYEDKEYDGISRFWDFSVREVVFVGDEEYVKTNMKVLSDEIINYAHEIGIDMQLKTAADAFFSTPQNRLKMKMQIRNELKKEFVAMIDGKEVALGSANYHGNHFSKPFDFDNGNKVVSGCIGLGLERWIAAL